MKILILSHSIFLLVACGGIQNSQYFEYLSTTEEAPLCLDNYSYAATVRVTGTAEFYKRGIVPLTQINSTTDEIELENLTLGDPLQEALPIRFAEVVVYNSQNKVVQCGRTDNLGFLKATDTTSDLLIPATPDTYSIQVLSRSYLTFNSVPSKPEFLFNAAVKKDKYTHQLYTLKQNSFSNGVDEVTVSLTAYARQTESSEVDGGAFNILNDLYTTYSYINSSTGTIDTQCLNTRINVYWKAGFNPFQYYYPDADPSTLGSNSYYHHDGDKGLYITGGSLGNTSIVNTDHFDDYVIIHELGHFIEDHCGQLITPGGKHFMTSRIEPQLAWSEGWANYIAGQVMYSNLAEINPEFEARMSQAGFGASDLKWSFLSTTWGFSDSQLNVGNGTGIMFDLRKPGNNPDTWQDGLYEGFAIDKVDPTRYPGEGHFREGAISRGLFKLSNHCDDTCVSALDTPVSFETVWQAVDKLTGVGQSTVKFKSSHNVIENIKTAVTSPVWISDFQNIANSETLHLHSDNAFISGGAYKWVPYGAQVVSQAGTCTIPFHIEPRIDDPVLAGSNSDQRYSNHFILIDLAALPSMNTISVSFQKQTGTDTEFDLLLFEEGYLFNMDYTCSSFDVNDNCTTSWVPSRTTTSDVVRSDRTANTTSKRITNLQSLDTTKKYLLNIRAYTPGKSISSTTYYSYEIQHSLTDTGLGSYLCL